MPTVAEEIAKQVRDSTARFELSAHADHRSHLLSGGQKQLLAMAAVLIHRPAVVVADGPTTLLNLRNARMVSELLSTLDEHLILVTHHLHRLAGFDRVQLIQDGTPAQTTARDEAIHG
jgi:biotin transport system ATP-binding protein